MSRRSSCRNKCEASSLLANKKGPEEDDVLAKLLSALAEGISYYYCINVNIPVKICLSEMLGFRSKADYLALLVSRKLTIYEFNKRKGEMHVEIQKDK